MLLRAYATYIQESLVEEISVRVSDLGDFCVEQILEKTKKFTVLISSGFE